MTISHFIIAILVGKFSHDWPGHRAAGWVSVAFLLFYMLSFGASWGPVPWAMPSEIFPSSLRAKGVALSTCSNWLNNFIIGLITPPLVQNTGFGAVCDDHPFPRGGNADRRLVHFLCSVLLALIGLDIFLRPGNLRENAGGMLFVEAVPSHESTSRNPSRHEALLTLAFPQAMDHVFKDIVSEDEEARRKAIESDLIGSSRGENHSRGKSP